MSFPVGASEQADGRREALRYDTLRQVANAMTLQREPRGLLIDLASRLRLALPLNFLNVVLHDPRTNEMKLHLVGAQPFHPVQWTAEQTTAGWVWQMQRGLFIPDARRESRFPRALAMLREHNVRSYYVLPMSTGTSKLGTIAVGSSEPEAYCADDLEFFQSVVQFITVAMEKTLKTREVEHERDRLQLLLSLSKTLFLNRSREELFSSIASSLRRVVHHDITTLTLCNPQKCDMRTYTLTQPDTQSVTCQSQPDISPGAALAAEVLAGCKPIVFNFQELATRESDELIASFVGNGIQSICIIPITTARARLGTLNLLSRGEQSFASSDMDLLGEIGAQIGIALENVSTVGELAGLTQQIAHENVYLEDESRRKFPHIVGNSWALNKVLAQVKNVAQSDATVLILGETGTGKELIARATHDLSNRHSRPFIKVNCAAIPGGLLESELFGHEKGAFTGAVSQKLGRFEMADQGTLFLDEVGDIAPELQSKLLRALQDQEFERLGGTRTIRVNVRVLAATKRNLAQMVVDGQFRSDLFYRLNVFPIQVPPLRDRRSDIPMLVRHFVQKFARRENMRIETIPPDAMRALVSWSWPGNVRELGNFIERAVIVTKGSVLQVPIDELGTDTAPLGDLQTLERAEREYIRRALRESHGVVSGPSGAAVRLGLKRTTLLYKMEKLGISSFEFRAKHSLS